MKNKDNKNGEETLTDDFGSEINGEEITTDNLKAMLDDFYQKVDGRVKNISNEIKTNIIPKTEKKLKQNVFSTVLIAVGVGFILGMLVMLFGFLNGKKR